MCAGEALGTRAVGRGGLVTGGDPVDLLDTGADVFVACAGTAREELLPVAGDARLLILGPIVLGEPPLADLVELRLPGCDPFLELGAPGPRARTLAGGSPGGHA